MTIRAIDKSEIERYKVFTGQWGSIFNTVEWLGIFEDEVKVYLLLDNDNQMVGAFHLCTGRLWLIPHIKNPSFTPNCGLFFNLLAKNKSKQSAFEKNIATELSAFLSGFRGILTVAFPDSIKDFQPFYWKKFKVIPNYTYLIGLQQNQEAIFDGFSPERRNDIKKAQKDGLTAHFVSDHKNIRDLVMSTFDRQKNKIQIDILDRILFQFANPDNSFAIEVKKENILLAGIFCVYDKRRVYYLLSGYDNSNRHSGAVALGIWEAIKKGKNLGVEAFDFEGSMIPRVEKFFRDFGGDLIPYYTINKAWLPFEILLKMIKRNRF